MTSVLILSALLGVGESDRFFKALAQVESSGNPAAIGDKGRAWGLYQVRQEYLDEAVRIAGKEAVVGKWGRMLTLKDMLEPSKARWVVEVWLGRYGSFYGRSRGSMSRMEYLARCHNGGPSGWKKEATKAYWKKVAAALEKSGLSGYRVVEGRKSNKPARRVKR